MWKTEEDFPRGGSKSKTVEKNLEANAQISDIPEKVDVSSSGTTKKTFSGRKRQRSATPSPLKSSKRQKTEVLPVVDIPLHKDLSTELCILGCVRHAQGYSVSVSLPGNLVAALPITEISPAYTQQLQALAYSEDPDTLEILKPVDELLKPGMLLSVMIKDIIDDKQRGKKSIRLSSLPSGSNANIPLKNIKDGMLLFGNISSVEDHGYRLDLGIKGIQAFLTTKDAEKYIRLHNNDSPLCIGQPIWCVLKMKDSSSLKAGESRVVSVTIDPAAVQNATVSENTKLSCFVPGMSLNAVVQKATKSGIFVSVLNFDGVIHSTQLPKSATEYKPGEELPVKILYIGANKIIQLTALPKIVHFNGSPLQLFGDLSVGAVQDATVTRVDTKRGVYFKLPCGVKGFCAISHLSDKENPDITKYEKGMVCQCRTLGFNFMEGVALITLKQSILKEKFLSVQDISVGDTTEAVVKEVTSNGVVVKLSRGIFSFVPCLHLADVPIKHPEKKFEAGMKMKCRVLKVDYKKSKVMLTHKKSLVKTKFPILTDYSQLRPHMELEGYILAVKENVVIVSFFNDVKGFVTLKDMSTEKVDDPSTLFYIGQVIRCRVVYFNVEEKKLKLSFNFGQKGANRDTADSPVKDSSYKIGKIVEARITRREKDRFRVLLLPDKEVAFLPFAHLSDFHEIQELRKMALKPGQQLSKVTFFTKKRETIISMKESVLHAAETNNFVENFENLKTGTALPAVIKNHQDYGMFLELAAGHLGLCPAKTLTYLQPSNLQELFQPGQSVVARLNKIDSEKKRFLGSVRLDECYEGGIDDSLALLRDYLQSREETLQLLFAEHNDLSVYEELSVGDIVEVTISSVLKKGVLGDLDSGAKALATKKHLGGIVPEVGNKHKAVIMFVDPLTPCVELTLDQKLVKAFATRKENSKTQLKNGQVLKADVQVIKPEFMLMSLRAHGAGKFVYIPVKRHMNDVGTDKPYEIGTFTEVVLKNPCGENVIGVLKSQDPEVMEKEKHKINFKNLPAHDMKPGMVIDAQVKVVHPLQMNIISGRLHGRVHITEVTDSFDEGKNPLHKFRQGHTLKVKVIGLRDLKTQSYLPITHPKAKRTLLECTLRDSKLNTDPETELLKPKLDVKIGDEITVYIVKVSSNKLWVQTGLNQQGYIDMFHFSDDMTVLNDIKNHFQTGQAYKAVVVECEDVEKLILSRIGGKMKIAVGEAVTAQITSIKPGVCLNVKLPEGRLGVVNAKPSVLHYVGQYIRCAVEEVEDSSRIVLSLLDQSKGPALKVRKRKRDTSVSEMEKKTAEKEIIKKKKEAKKQRKKRTPGSEDQDDSGVDVAKDSSDAEETEVQFQMDCKDTDKMLSAPKLSIQQFSWDGELSTNVVESKDDSDDDGGEGIKVDSNRAKKKRKLDEEKLIQEYERSQLEGNVSHHSATDFERLVLQSPNSSVIWLRYMAFHVELGEIEKARAVAEKALNTISFREEQEKKNVWLAYLNMETIYGESDDVKKLLERAVSYNDPVDINLKMCDIYVAAGKSEEAERLYMLMTRKYKKNKTVWKAYGQYLFKSGRIQAARNLLQRIVSVLDKKDHVEVIAKFANMEFSDGDKERGRTMFENLIASYPSRTDLWSVYVDMVVKVGDVDGARQILERVVKQKMNSKKLSFLVQKFIRFEETHGTEEHVQHVKDMALSLFES